MSTPQPEPVEVRLIGVPEAVDRILTAISGVVITRGTRKPTRDRDGRVIQYAIAIKEETA